MRKSVNTQGTDGGSVTVGLPRYEVIDKDGNSRGTFHNKKYAVDWAEANLSGEQDTSAPDEEPNGWFLELIPAKKSLAD